VGCLWLCGCCDGWLELAASGAEMPKFTSAWFKHMHHATDHHPTAITPHQTDMAGTA
jgi:hypothetical protein